MSRAPILKNGRAFGVDPRRKETYSLRQSRYYAIGLEVSKLAEQAAAQGKKLRVLDVGVGPGQVLRYTEPFDAFEHCEWHGADIDKSYNLYRSDLYLKMEIGDLTKGYANLASDYYDVVVCEQVLEHLHDLDVAMQTLERVLKPGGTLIVGVPIFPPGLDLIRKHIIPITDKYFSTKKRGHVQAFSRGSFIRELQKHTNLEFVSSRGFRIFSGGILRPLEYSRAWWNLANFTGKIAPALCIEIQVIARKPVGKYSAATHTETPPARKAA